MAYSSTSVVGSARWMRFLFNIFPAYRGSGARVIHIAPDFRTARVRLPLNWRTRNYVGTTFGGSMFAAVDPVYMIMLMKNLGPDYVVWDKAASIDFRRPGRSTLEAEFLLTEEGIASIRADLEEMRAIERTYEIHLRDQSGETCAVINKLIYMRKRRAEE